MQLKKEEFVSEFSEMYFKSNIKEFNTITQGRKYDRFVVSLKNKAYGSELCPVSTKNFSKIVLNLYLCYISLRYYLCNILLFNATYTTNGNTLTVYTAYTTISLLQLFQALRYTILQ